MDKDECCDRCKTSFHATGCKGIEFRYLRLYMENCARCNTIVVHAIQTNQYIMNEIGGSGEGEYVTCCRDCKSIYEKSGIEDRYLRARNIYWEEFLKFAPHYK